MFGPIKTFVFEIFQDQDGGASMKRAMFFLFGIAFLAIAGGVYFHHVDAASLDYLKTIQGYLKDIEIWLGGFILAEKTPAAAAAFKGNKTP